MLAADLDLRQFAVLGLVQEASRLALGYFRKSDSLGITMKGAQDWLTVADGAVEALLRERLAVLFPDDAVIGEEGGGEAADAVWIIDPIDGTANFAHGDRNWCISIGLLLNGVPVIGIVCAPALDEIYVGRRGRGATLNGEPLRVSGQADIARSCIEIGWSTRISHADYLATVQGTLAAGASIRRVGSGTLGICHVAAGRTDGYAERHINAWDVAAAMAIAAEAGADLNDFFAGDGIRSGNPILCCTPELSAELERITGIICRRRGD
ncbi:inositol monophosphatase [Bosea sp. (in: a-proteobacteria)]|uniref:inositol monophosphatase family protein n=1 Tax=Bosea sp. (in: a-proteobacteria) TaxID=1871050 RepID=UPI0025BBF50F|nr:inositol monophosphatase [Bosea sp. (in: a-proteobacteria)]